MQVVVTVAGSRLVEDFSKDHDNGAGYLDVGSVLAVRQQGQFHPRFAMQLNFVADPNYRRQHLSQLNRGEGRGRISRKVFHGQRGEFRQRYRQCGATCAGHAPPAST
jgi:hypothetical protein